MQIDPVDYMQVGPVDYKSLTWLLVKLLTALGIFIGTLLLRKKVINSIANEKEVAADVILKTNQTKEDQATGQLIVLNQKKADVQTQIDQVNNSNPNDAQVLEFFKNSQSELDKDGK